DRGRGRDDGNRDRDNNRWDNNRGRDDRGRNDNRYSDRGRDWDRNRGRGHRDWNRSGWDRSYWRSSWNHGWRGNRYRAPARYYYPRGYNRFAWSIGIRLPSVYYAPNYYVDYRTY